MNRDYRVLRFPLVPALSLIPRAASSSSVELLDFIRQREYIGKVDPRTNAVMTDVILLDLWVCSDCGEQFPEHDGVEEFLALHAKKHAYGLIRKVHQR